MSDDGSDSGGDIPFKKPDSPADDDEEDDEDEEVYVVEKIVAHEWKKSKLLFEVKWAGYDETTFEPEANLDGCPEELKTYYDSIGGKPQKGAKAATRKRSASAHDDAAAGKNGSSKRSRTGKQHEKSKSFNPPTGSWEDSLIGVETVSRDDNGELVAFVEWTNGQKSRHPTRLLYVKCPQKMLRFYEAHLFFYDGQGAKDPTADPAVIEADAAPAGKAGAVKGVASTVDLDDADDAVMADDDDDDEDVDVKGVAAG